MLLFINYHIKKHNNIATYYFLYKEVYINISFELIADCFFGICCIYIYMLYILSKFFFGR